MIEKMRIECENLDLILELDEYVIYLKENSKSDRTIFNYTNWIKDFLNFILKHPKDAEVLVSDDVYTITRFKLTAINFKNFMTKEGLKNSTINLKIIALNSFVKFLDLTEENRRGKNVLIKIPLLPTESKHSIEDNRLMELEDFMTLLEAAKLKNDLRAIALFQFLFSTGARISEALSVDIEKIQKVGNSYKVSIVGKRGKPRDIDFSKEVYTAIRDYLRATHRDVTSKGALFIATKMRDGEYKRLVPSTADYIIKEYAKETGLPITKFFAHNFRHLIAKTLLDEGATLDKVKNFLGHSNIATTSIYTMGKASELRDIKDTAIKSAKVRLLQKKFKGYEDILNILVEDPKTTDIKIAAQLGYSKSTFARKFSQITKDIRKELNS